MAEKKQGFNAEQERMLEKWQVPKKYYEMIEDLSYTKDEGYFIYLKKAIEMIWQAAGIYIAWKHQK